MKRSAALLETRHAILDALAHVIVESKGFGYSVQEIADRAGVTHRTVYNHFPTRDALSDGLADYLEERLAERGPPPDDNASLEILPRVIGEFYPVLAADEVHSRAYVMLTIANRQPARVARDRMRRLDEMIARDAALPPGLHARHVSAAIRMFVSSLGWHALTEHCGLSSEEAAVAAAWATRTLVEAVERTAMSKGNKTKAKAKPKAKRRSAHPPKTPEGGSHDDRSGGD
jgi:AcrR family transcriptional regulator